MSYCCKYTFPIPARQSRGSAEENRPCLSSAGERTRRSVFPRSIAFVNRHSSGRSSERREMWSRTTLKSYGPQPVRWDAADRTAGMSQTPDHRKSSHDPAESRVLRFAGRGPLKTNTAQTVPAQCERQLETRPCLQQASRLRRNVDATCAARTTAAEQTETRLLPVRPEVAKPQTTNNSDRAYAMSRACPCPCCALPTRCRCQARMEDSVIAIEPLAVRCRRSRRPPRSRPPKS